jgi:alpha-L-arabinofuranosidase
MLDTSWMRVGISFIRLLQTTSPGGPTFASTFEGTNVPVLDAVVSRSANGQQIFIKVVNTDPAQAIPMQILVTGARVTKKARIETANGN